MHYYNGLIDWSIDWLIVWLNIHSLLLSYLLALDHWCKAVYLNILHLVSFQLGIQIPGNNLLLQLMSHCPRHSCNWWQQLKLRYVLSTCYFTIVVPRVIVASCYSILARMYVMWKFLRMKIEMYLRIFILLVAFILLFSTQFPFPSSCFIITNANLKSTMDWWNKTSIQYKLR